MPLDHNPQSTAKIGGHPIHPMLIPFPIAFFVATLVTDLVFLKTGAPGWATAGKYLLGAGLVMAALAAVAGLTDYLGSPDVRRLKAATQHMIGNVTAVVIEVVNLGMRMAGGDVRPWGVALSAAVVAILLYTGWKGWEMVYRGHVGVSDEATPLSR